MRNLIDNIIKKEVNEFSYISVEKYISQRQQLNKHDVFTNTSFLDDYKTIITLMIPYPSQPVKWKGKGYGILSRYSYGVDYHLVYKDILKRLTDALEKEGVSCSASSDISFVDERFAAYLSGLGFLGKNQFLINRNYGSYGYLATILIDHQIDDEIHQYDDCKDCSICIDACPSNALNNGFDENKCISSLSQLKKTFTEKEVRYFKTMIYGCDICQKVCPKNKGIDIHKYHEFEPDGRENIHIGELLDMSNKTYKTHYGNNASSWKGASIIKRNALCLIANQKLVEYREKIVKSMADKKNILWYNETAQIALNLLDRE